jgi:hypothetical protein
MDPLKPSTALLVKLGSLAVHADEYLSDQSHDFDKYAILSLLADQEVKHFLAEMSKMGFLPVKR